MIDLTRYEGHTPGPWVMQPYLSGSENHKGYYVKCQKFVLAREVMPVDSDGVEGGANARLIADAPLLLSTLLAEREAVADFIATCERLHAAGFDEGDMYDKAEWAACMNARREFREKLAAIRKGAV